MLAKDMNVDVRFQNSADPSVDFVMSVNKSWTWSALLTEIGTNIDVAPEKISHLVLLNKTGSEISLNISDFAKFKRILNMYSSPSEMKFNVLFSKSLEEKKKSMRLRFRLSTNVRRNLDITVPEQAGWKEITDLIITEFSLKEPVHHLVLVNREGENVSNALDASESFWAVASTFNIEKDGVFVVYNSDAPTQKSPFRPHLGMRSTPPRGKPTSVQEEASTAPVSPAAAIVFPGMDSLPAAPVSAKGSSPPHEEPAPLEADERKFPSLSLSFIVSPELDPPEDVAEKEGGDPPSPDAKPCERAASPPSMAPIAQEKGGGNEVKEEESPSVAAVSSPDADENKSAVQEPVMALFCLSDDKQSVVKVVLSDFVSWSSLVESVCTAFGINAECVLYFFLVDKDNDEISPFLRNAEKFWRIFNKKYSLAEGKKFVVEIDSKKRLVSNSFSVLVKLSSDCEHLAPSNPVRNVSFPRDCGWAGLSKALTDEFDLPGVSVKHFIVLDADGDEMSPHLNTVETFWKAASTFVRDHGDAMSVHFDDSAIKTSLLDIERRNFLESAARFQISLDCDRVKKGQCLVTDEASWTDIIRAIVDCLSLTNGSALQKIVLLDADGTPLSPDITDAKKFWKIFNVKYKNSPNSFFVCTFMEASRQKAFFDLCASGMQTASLLDLIRKGVDVNAVCTEATVAGTATDSSALRGVHLAAMGGHVATLRVLCSLDCLEVHHADSQGRTPLYLACQSGSGESVQLLIDKGAAFDGQDEVGKTALHMLAIHGFEVVKNHETKLRDALRNRVSLQSMNAFDDTWSTPLMYACKRGDHIIAKVFLEFGAILNLRDKDGMSPLLHCIGSGSYKLLTLLLQHNPNISARNNVGEDALLLTAGANNQRMAECLIGRQMDIQTRNALGQSLYQVATAASYPALAQWFAKQGAGKTALTSKAQRHLFHTDQSLEKRLRQEEIKNAEEILGVSIKVSNITSPESSVTATGGALKASAGVDGDDGDAVKMQKKTTHLKLNNLTLRKVPGDKNATVINDLFNACKNGETDRVREICRMIGDSVDLSSIACTTGDTLLHIACYIGNLELCKFLHRQGLVINAKDSVGYTPFHCACDEGLIDIATWMASVGGSCTVTDDKLMTPMHYACQNQRKEVIKLLSSVNDCSLSAKDKTGKVPVQYISQWTGENERDIQGFLIELLQGDAQDTHKAATILLPDVAFKGRLSVVEFILDLNCCNVDARSAEDGQSAMHRACRGGKLDVVKLLVRRKADLTLRDYNEMTPFLHACCSNNLELVKYLASSGPKGILFDVDQNGDNGLHFCTRNHDTEMVKWLLQRGLDCNQPNYKKCAPVDLPEASDWSELKLVYREHQMVQTAPKPKDRRLLSYVDRDAATIYEMCSSGVQDEILAMVESGDNLDVETKDGTGYTALHIACDRGNYSVVSMLTKNGCHFNREATDGETPLYLACKNGHMSIARLLVELGVDIHEPVADSTLLHAAAAAGHFNIVQWLNEMGVSVDVLDSSGFSAMHIAARDNSMEAVRHLFDLGAQIDVHGINAPLHVACFLGNLDIAKWLVSKGAKPDALHEGRNAFLIASSGGQKEVAMWLDSMGTDINCVNPEDGLTALHRACMVENVELADWLLSRNPEFIRMRATDMKSPLCTAVLACNDELVDLCERYIMSSTEEAIALDEIRDDIIDLLGNAMMEEDFSAAPFMLQRLMLHTDPKYVFSDGCTVLHFAAAIGDLEVLSYLLSHNAVVDARSDVGKTPLHYAAITGEIACAEQLINAGADCLAKDVSDRDAMQFAQYFKRKPFVKWLKRLPAYIEATTPRAGSFIFACLPVGSTNPGMVDFSDSDAEECSRHSGVSNSSALDGSIYPG